MLEVLKAFDLKMMTWKWQRRAQPPYTWPLGCRQSTGTWLLSTHRHLAVVNMEHPVRKHIRLLAGSFKLKSYNGEREVFVVSEGIAEEWRFQAHARCVRYGVEGKII
jgi:hypothetical protein